MAQKMNQVLAVEKVTKNRIETEFTKIYQNIGKAELLNGFQKNYTPLEENGAKLPPESKKVQFKAEDQIKKVKKELAELLDISAIKDKTNTVAKADISVNGVVLVTDVPATYLLYLEHKLADLSAFAKKLPLLDQSENWKRDEALGLWATESFKSVRTKKVEEINVIVPPTKEHPAQVAKFVKDVPEGNWETVKYSGAMQSDKVDSILERIEELQRAVKSARAQANVTVADESLKPGAVLLNYIFG